MQFRDEAEMEYLKIAQDLEMYGVSYFSITVSVDFCVCVCFYIDLWKWANIEIVFIIQSTAK